MKNFHVKSMILGIGIGLIITSIISIIYLAGMKPSSQMSKEEIIKKAREYGMIDSSELIIKNKGSNTEANSEQKKDNTADVKIDETVKQKENLQQAAVEGREIKISIEPGDSSEVVADKLLKAGLINDKTAFVNKLTDMGLATGIFVGEFKFKKGSDLEAIIKRITSP